MALSRIGSKLYFLLQRYCITAELCSFGISPGGKAKKDLLKG
jgi:hypothetical protein